MSKLIRGCKALYGISLVFIILYSGVSVLKSILMSVIFDENSLSSVRMLVCIVIGCHYRTTICRRGIEK